MNVGVLECKRKAIEITSSDNPPLGVNGKKKGYIEVLEELWNSKEYCHLNLNKNSLIYTQNFSSTTKDFVLGKNQGLFKSEVEDK